jgi:hypothetical protein
MRPPAWSEHPTTAAAAPCSTHPDRLSAGGSQPELHHQLRNNIGRVIGDGQTGIADRHSCAKLGDDRTVLVDVSRDRYHPGPILGSR